MAAGPPRGSTAALSPTRYNAPLILAIATTEPVYEMRVGGITDPGVPGKQNQDDFFVWDFGDGQNLLLGVLDGHGRELGAMAANVAKRSMLRTLLSNFSRLRTDPEEVMRSAFAQAHADIRTEFQRFYQRAGWHVEEEHGYLIRRRPDATSSSCIPGGTTATVMAVLDGRHVVVAHVGDSTALICGAGAAVQTHDMSSWAPLKSSTTIEGGRVTSQAAGASAPSPSTVADGAPSTRLRHPVTGPRGELSIDISVSELNTAMAATASELSDDHSPESAAEFRRIRASHPDPANPLKPHLRFVYDALAPSKSDCKDIFAANRVQGEEVLTVSRPGTYFKNVRNEWATLICTPPTATYSDALAFTRSLGDFHLHAYGVSSEPEVRWFDMLNMQDHLGAPITCEGPLVLSLCSDGVWDNWRFEDVAGFLLHPGRVKFALTHETAQACCVDLMQATLERARVNFGTSADNMTAVMAYAVPNKEALRTATRESQTGTYNASVGTGVALK